MTEMNLLTPKLKVNIEEYTKDMAEVEEFDLTETEIVADPEWRARLSRGYQDCYDISESIPSQGAVGHLVFLGTLEEHHLSAEHPLERVAGEGLGGDALGDVVAVLVAAAEPRAPLGVRHDLGLGQVKLLHLGHVLGVLLDVDLQLGGQ